MDSRRGTTLSNASSVVSIIFKFYVFHVTKKNQNKKEKLVELKVKGRNEDGEIVIEGTLNPKEHSFLVQYAISDLLGAGVQFNLNKEDLGDIRMKFPQEAVN